MAKPDKINIDKVLDDVAKGMSIVKACVSQGCSSQTFYDKMKDDPELKERYTRAREDRGDCCTDKIEEYQKKLENGEIDAATARVLIDTEKWKAGKFNQKMYGDKQAVELTGKDGQALNPPIINVLLEDSDESESNAS